MSKLKKILINLFMCLGIQMSGIVLYFGVLEENIFAYIGAIGSFIFLTSSVISNALEV